MFTLKVVKGVPITGVPNVAQWRYVRQAAQGYGPGPTTQPPPPPPTNPYVVPVVSTAGQPVVTTAGEPVVTTAGEPVVVTTGAAATTTGFELPITSYAETLGPETTVTNLPAHFTTESIIVPTTPAVVPVPEGECKFFIANLFKILDEISTEL